MNLIIVGLRTVKFIAFCIFCAPISLCPTQGLQHTRSRNQINLIHERGREGTLKVVLKYELWLFFLHCWQVLARWTACIGVLPKFRSPHDTLSLPGHTSTMGIKKWPHHPSLEWDNWLERYVWLSKWSAHIDLHSEMLKPSKFDTPWLFSRTSPSRGWICSCMLPSLSSGVLNFILQGFLLCWQCLELADSHIVLSSPSSAIPHNFPVLAQTKVTFSRKSCHWYHWWDGHPFSPCFLLWCYLKGFKGLDSHEILSIDQSQSVECRYNNVGSPLYPVI